MLAQRTVSDKHDDEDAEAEDGDDDDDDNTDQGVGDAWVLQDPIIVVTNV